MWDENIHFPLVISMSISQLLIAQYLIGIIYAITYQPLGSNLNFDYAYNPAAHNLQVDVPRWVIIDKVYDYPNCRLTPQDNYPNEEHTAIIGNGNYLHPNGPFALFPRYYIKKRLIGNDQVKIFALMNPQANSLPNHRIRQQLLSIVCHRPGRIETIDPDSRIWSGRRNGTRKVRLLQGTCGIEERLIDICLGDSDVGSLIDRDYLFTNEDPNYPEPHLDHVMNHLSLALSCEKFFIIELPSLANFVTHTDMSEIILYYLKGGQRAGFDIVMMNGLGLGEQCQPQHLGWDNYCLNNLVTDDPLRRNLLGRTTSQGMPAWNNQHFWFFCKTVV